MHLITSKIAAGCLSLSAFTVAIAAGLSSGNPAAQILRRALLAMIACYVVGFIIGLVCEHVVAAHAQSEAEALAKAEGERAADAARAAPDPTALEEEPIIV